MRNLQFAVLALAGFLAAAPAAQAQPRPYIGFVYPAGGRQGTTFQIRLGGQGLDDVNQAIVSGTGVSAKVVDYYRRIGAQELTLLREQLNELKGGTRGTAAGPAKALATSSTKAPTATSGAAMMAEGSMVQAPAAPGKTPAGAGKDDPTLKLMARIENRLAEYVARPACASISSIVLVEVTIAPDAKPGPRELTVATPRGVSNPLVFHVGQLPEVSRKPMKTAELQVLGKEEQALRKRPEDEVEDRITVPCVLNGQIASGEVNRYRFEAHKGQRLVISAQARQLIPYVADAVPGWFQPVITLYNAAGKEVAYSDDYRFKPDPLILCEVPKDGEYVLHVTDAIYRGREDFVYRVTIGELPFVTSIFPLGGRAGASVTIRMKGWNLEGAELTPPTPDAAPGVHPVAARKDGLVSNRLPFALDTLPECVEKEPNNDPSHAQKVKLPIIVNGRIDHPGDWDVFQFAGRDGDTIVAEVSARRLDSPLDSILKLTDAAGKLLAFNDDHEDAASGVNTHDADSYLMVKLPADGTYYVYLGDVARHGGEEYAYRLRLSAPQPDFALYVVPSSVVLRSKATGTVSVHAIRKDGFAGAIKVGLKDPPAGFSSPPSSVSPTQAVPRLAVRTNLTGTNEPVNLSVEGRATIGGRDVAHQAVPAEDRMQAFLWRHLVPAEDLKVLVLNPSYQPPPKRVPRVPAPSAAQKKPPVASVDPAAGKPKFTKQQVAGRLRQLKILFEDGLLTDDFYERKVAECEAGL